MAFVSVIIPTYNRASLISRAVDSVLDQTFDDFECIVVDDGSTDNTLDVLDKYDDKRLKVIHIDNCGVSGARNIGIHKSSGKYIALLDSDDEFDKRKLELQLDFMKENSFEISQTDEIWIRKGKRVNQCKKHLKPEGYFFDKSLEMCMVSPSCVIFSRQFIDTCGLFDENMKACEDYDLWIRSALKFPVGLLKQRLTIKHGGRSDQLSNSIRCLDLLRIYSIIKIINKGELANDNYNLAVSELERKAKFFIGGCIKRGKEAEAKFVTNVVAKVKKQDIVNLEELMAFINEN